MYKDRNFTQFLLLNFRVRLQNPVNIIRNICTSGLIISFFQTLTWWYALPYSTSPPGSQGLYLPMVFSFSSWQTTTILINFRFTRLHVVTSLKMIELRNYFYKLTICKCHFIKCWQKEDSCIRRSKYFLSFVFSKYIVFKRTTCWSDLLSLRGLSPCP